MTAESPAPSVSRGILYGLLAIVLLAPTQYGFPIGKNHLSVVDPLVWAVFGLWLWQAWRSGSWRRLRVNLVFPALFVAWAALSLARAPNLPRSAFKVLQHAEYFIAAYLLFAASMADRRAFRWLLGAFLSVSALAVLAGAAHYLAPGVADFKVRSFFGNAHVFGGFLSLALPLMLALGLQEGLGRWRHALTAGAAAGMLVTLSGGTFLALAAAFGCAAMARGWKAFAAYAALLLAAMLVVLPALPRKNAEVLRQSIALYDDDGNVTRRYPEWQAAAEMTREHPWLGVGSGCYQERIGEFYGIIPVVGGAAAPADSQNLYLVLASSMGLPGLFAFLGILLGGAAQALRGLAREADPLRRAVRLGAACSLAAFMVNAVWSPLLVRGIGIPLVLILALAASRERAP